MSARLALTDLVSRASLNLHIPQAAGTQLGGKLFGRFSVPFKLPASRTADERPLNQMAQDLRKAFLVEGRYPPEERGSRRRLDDALNRWSARKPECTAKRTEAYISRSCPLASPGP
jgi:hypothetical protein